MIHKHKIIINLDPDFQPYGEGVKIKKLMFPSGCEPHIKLPDNLYADFATITCRIKSSDDIMYVLLTVDALKRMDIKSIRLFIPYLPFARQDRVMVEGEPLSVKVIADLINSQKFIQVSIYDPHSEVCLALINNVSHIQNYSFVQKVLEHKRIITRTGMLVEDHGFKNDFLIVSPDNGAYKKIFKLCKEIGYKDQIVLCNKVRDVATSKIQNITVDATDLQGKDLYIIDDICSKGGTFLMLAEKLKKLNCGNIYLVVSHYEGCADEQQFKDAGIAGIYKTDSMNDIETDFIKNIKLQSISL